MVSVSESDERTLDEAEASTTTSHGTARISSPGPQLPSHESGSAGSIGAGASSGVNSAGDSFGSVGAPGKATSVRSASACGEGMGTEAARSLAAHPCTSAKEALPAELGDDADCALNPLQCSHGVPAARGNGGADAAASDQSGEASSAGKSSAGGGPGGLLAGLAGPLLRGITGAARRPSRSQCASPALSSMAAQSARPSQCVSPRGAKAHASSGHGSDAASQRLGSGSAASSNARASNQSRRSSDLGGPELDAASRLSSHAVPGLQTDAADGPSVSTQPLPEVAASGGA